MTKEELDRILAAHKAWLNNEPGGNRAILSGAILSGADLRWADLRGADMSRTDMSGAILSGADMSWAILSGADMSRAILSGADGLLKACNFMDAHFERTAHGYIAYKAFGGEYGPPEAWKIEAGSVLEENVNPDRARECGCGINVAPLDWVKAHYRGTIWKVLIRWEWLPGVVVPYGTDGEIRCEKVEPLGVVE